MTYDKVKISFLTAVLAVSIASILFDQSFAQQNNLNQEQERENAINQQLGLFSSSAKLGEKKPIEGYDRMISSVDPGIGHENHQLAVLIPISEKEYTGTLYYSASEPVQLVSLKGPLEPGEEKGKSVWTPDNETYYELTIVSDYSSSGEWSFVGNALAVHTFKSTPFVVDYKLDYSEVEDTNIMSKNSLNDVSIKAEFSFDSGTITIDSFDVFKQVSGFEKVQPQIILQGIVGIDKSQLYRAADYEYNKKSSVYDHEFSEFGMKIYLEQDDIPIRMMTYRECDISNYTIDTLYDNDYSYNRASVFVLVDNFEITCKGMQPYHYDYQKYIDEYGVDAVMKMKNMEMTPKDYQSYNLDG
ncbi:MAG: hypothetical protein HKM23_01155 [Nitrosopumilus sp.]|nr:hypothetical protein [Nitrosopumilus sp.]NNL58829.1 hypothetical protein [Nitrosopumilus sp.]